MSKSENQVFDFEKICRLCLGEKRSMSAIFTKKKSDKKVPLPVRIMSCASLELFEGDGMPTSICNKCLVTVNASYAFREQCEQADTTLRRYAAQQQEKEGKVEELDEQPQEQEYEEEDDEEREDMQQEEAEQGDSEDQTEPSPSTEDANTTTTRKKGMEAKLRSEVARYYLAANTTHTKVVDDEEEGGGQEKMEMKEIKKLKQENMEIGEFQHEVWIDDLKQEHVYSSNEAWLCVEAVNPGSNCRKKRKRRGITAVTSTSAENISVEVDPSVVQSDPEKTPENSAKGKRPIHRCEDCPKVYPSMGGLSYHRFVCHSLRYTPPVCDLCGKSFRIQKYLDSHKNTVHFKVKEHLCDICGKDFTSKYGLKLHKIWHVGEKNFPCDVCGKRFSTTGKVNTHKQVHGGPKNYICEVCSRAFRWKKSLHTHMRTHSGERPYKCEHCDKTFSALWNMQQHLRIHTGERPYSCDICDKKFALNASMKEHRSRHHKEADARVSPSF